MKKYLLTLTLIFVTSLLSDELKWVDAQVEAIKPPRKGMQTQELSGIKDPFVFLVKKEKTKEANVASSLPNSATTPMQMLKKTPKPLILSLVLNNKAMINETWYKKGDTVEGYKVSEIHQNEVLLTSKKKKLLLSTRTSSKNLKFNNK